MAFQSFRLGLLLSNLFQFWVCLNWKPALQLAYYHVTLNKSLCCILCHVGESICVDSSFSRLGLARRPRWNSTNFDRSRSFLKLWTQGWDFTHLPTAWEETPYVSFNCFLDPDNSSIGGFLCGGKFCTWNLHLPVARCHLAKMSEHIVLIVLGWNDF